MEIKQRLRPLWPFPGRLHSGLAQGMLHCESWGLPRWREAEASEEEMALRDLTLAGKVIYDIGANTGEFTLFFARQAGGRGHVVAFEPVPANCEVVRRNVQLNHIGNVTLVPLGLAAAVAEREVVAMAGSSGRVSIMPGERSDPRYRPAGTIAVAPLDDVIAEWRLPPPDFLKIDVEGAELEVVQGASEVLRQRHPDLFIELHGQGPIRKAVAAERLTAQLESLGYAMFHVETAARVMPGAYVPGCGHLLCKHSLAA